jgi:hypothetical protein
MLLLDKLRRHVSLAVIAVLLLASIMPVLLARKASAYALVTERFIKMSSSANGATDVTYQVGFKPATTGTIGGMVVTFCSNSPILGDSCTAPTGFNTNFATLALANVSASFGTGWAIDATNSTANTVILTNSTPQSFTAGTAGAFDLGDTGASDGVTNPTTTNQTFYARVITYDSDLHAQQYIANVGGGGPTAPALGTGNIDAGGFALSTAAQITITSKVQERLTFCVYTAANCAGGGTAVALGDTNGVLDPAGPYVDKNTQYDVATNASQGVAIRVKGDTLKSGSFDVAAIGSTAQSSSPGNEQFGFCTYQSTGSGLSAQTLYNNSNNCNSTTQTAGTATPGGAGSADFAFDLTNINSTYGDVFANKDAGSTSSGVIAFIGNISNTTEAGIYTTTLTFIATGTY